MKLDHFNCPRGLEVTIRAVVEPICPFTGARDSYRLLVWYRSSGKCAEAESIYRALSEYRSRRITQEALTQELLEVFSGALEPEEVCVELAGSHGAVTIESRACQRGGEGVRSAGQRS